MDNQIPGNSYRILDTRPRHSSGKACRPGRSEGNRITTIDRSGRRVTTAHGINLFRKDSLGRVPEQCVCSQCGKNRELIGYETSEQLESKNCRSKVLVRLVSKPICRSWRFCATF